MAKTRRKSNKGGASSDSERQSVSDSRDSKYKKTSTEATTATVTRKRNIRKKALERMRRPWQLFHVSALEYDDDGIYDGEVYDGEVYVEGDCEGTCPHGFGRIRWPNGEQYVGEWKHGERHGRGVHRWPDDVQIYEGEFKDDFLHGRGKMRWSDGRIYEGEWKKGGMQCGTMKWPNGDFYEGEWNDDGEMKCGKLVTNYGLKTFEGTFDCDKPAVGTTTHNPVAHSDAAISDAAISDAATTATTGDITTASTDKNS